MEAKNFRIGNLVRSKQWYGVGSIEGIEVLSDSWELKVKGYVHKWETGKYFDLEPIPITEEWLIKFGFDLVVKEGNQGEFRVYQLNEITYNTNHGWWWRHQLTVQPKYIHELQNLFFAITGNELELKTDV